MQFGAYMFSTDYSMPPDELARLLEDRGFESEADCSEGHVPGSRAVVEERVARG